MSVTRPNTTLLPRPDLAIVAAGCVPEFENFIAEEVVPSMSVDTETGVYAKVPVDAIVQMPDNRRGSGSNYARLNAKFTTANWYTKEYGLEEAVDRHDRERYPSGIVGENAALYRVVMATKRRRDKRVADACINTTTLPVSGTTGLTITTPWDSAAATPALDLATAAGNIQTKTGVPKSMLNLVLSRYNLDKLPFVTDVIDKLKIATAPYAGLITPEMAAAYFGVNKVIVPTARYNTASQDATPSLATIWNEDYAFLYFPMRQLNSMGTMQPGLGCTFRWAQQGMDYNVYAYGEDPVNSDVVRVEEFADEQLINTDYANLIYNTKT